MSNDTLQNKERPVRLLLIEDNHGDALLVQRAFERMSIENHITIATTGEEALRFLRHSRNHGKLKIPDIILLDLNLPGINGLEVLKALKNDDHLKRIPVIILSSSCAQCDVLNCYNNHANCYIKKASNLEELYELTDKIEQFWFKQVILPDEEPLDHPA
jgi:CheY-like chemotaxis protein